MASQVPRDPTLTPEMRRFLDDLARGTSIFDNKTATEATALLNVFTSLLKGLTPASGGGTTNFLRADVTWADPLSDTIAAWTDYTPTITASAGTFTSVSATGRYKLIGKTAFVHIAISITTNGTASGFVIATLPASHNVESTYHGRAGVSGKMLMGIKLAAATAAIFNYDGTYPGASGETLIVDGIYETT